MAQGLLTNKYLHGIPEKSRATKGVFLKAEQITENELNTIKQLNELALQRGQSLVQVALAWLLKDNRITTVLIGASKPEQLFDTMNCLDNLIFKTDELAKIGTLFKG